MQIGCLPKVGHVVPMAPEIHILYHLPGRFTDLGVPSPKVPRKLLVLLVSVRCPHMITITVPGSRYRCSHGESGSFYESDMPLGRSDYQEAREKED